VIQEWHQLGRLTTEEVAALDGERTLVVLPVGAVEQHGPHLPVLTDAIVAQALGQARLMMLLLGLFAGVALLLAAVGIYGAVAYSVAQRTGEIGVRIALGAQAADVLRLILTQGLMPVVVGLGIGIIAALALGRLLRTQLYQVAPHNPALLLATAIILGLVALSACLFPARRATQVDPIQALRTE